MALSKGIMHNLEHDCTLLCKSIDHGCQITSALTKRAVTDEQLAAYLNWICTNCGKVNDKEVIIFFHYLIPMIIIQLHYVVCEV